MLEDDIEQTMLTTLREMGWDYAFGPDIGPDGTGERDYDDVYLKDRLASAMMRLNPGIPGVAIEEAAKEAEKHKESTDKDELEAALKSLNDAIMPIGAKMYQQASEEPAAEDAGKKDKWCGWKSRSYYSQ